MSETAPAEARTGARLPYLEYAAFAALALIIIYQAFSGPVVGLASNGDYWRITDQVGLAYADPPEDETAYLVRTYDIVQPDDWAGYRSSELVLVHTALTVNRVIAKDFQFDLRVLGAIHAAMYLLGAGLTLSGVRRFGLLPRALVSLLLLLIFSDVAYVSYFNSLYSEPASLIFLLLTTGLGLMVITREENDRRRTAWLVLFFLAAALLVTAKPQNALLGIPLAVAGYRLSGVALLPNRLDYQRHLLPGGLALGLLAVSLLYPMSGQPQAFREANLFNVVFNEILRTSPDPAADLEALGLEQDLIEYAGMHAYEPGSPVTEESFHPRFFDRIGYRDIAWFYLRHPGRLIDLAGRGAESTNEMRPDYLGNFTEASGLPPGSRSQAFAVWSNRKLQLLPNSLAFLTVFLAASLAVAAAAHRLFRERRSVRLAAELHVALVIGVGVQFMTVLVGEGEYEIVKHLFLYHALFDMSLLFLALLVGNVATMLWCRYRTPRNGDGRAGHGESVA